MRTLRNEKNGEETKVSMLKPFSTPMDITKRVSSYYVRDPFGRNWIFNTPEKFAKWLMTGYTIKDRVVYDEDTRTEISLEDCLFPKETSDDEVF